MKADQQDAINESNVPHDYGIMLQGTEYVMAQDTVAYLNRQFLALVSCRKHFRCYRRVILMKLVTSRVLVLIRTFTCARWCCPLRTIVVQVALDTFCPQYRYAQVHELPKVCVIRGVLALLPRSVCSHTRIVSHNESYVSVVGPALAQAM